MRSLKLVEPYEIPNIGHLRRHDALQNGRANALDLLVNGRPLDEVIGQLVQSLESSTDDLRCGVMLLSDDKQSLSPFVLPGFSTEYIDALSNLPVGPDMGCCGAAVHSRELTVVEDIVEHPNWLNFKGLAIKEGIRACWSYPIISPDGELFGTFAMYFSQCKVPDQDDLESLQYEAKLVSIILERARNIEQLKQANQTLEQHVQERTKELTEANLLLKKALEQRNEVQSQLVEMENMAALGTMMSSLTHEINTPIGVAITAISHLRAMQQNSFELFNKGQLKRSELEHFYQECEESSDIIERNLVRSTQLIKTFKQLSIDQHSQDARAINLCGYIDEILLSLKPRLKQTSHKFCVDINPDLEVMSNPGAISQLLINLIMNSAQHGFTQNETGHIWLRARLLNNTLELRYRDNGKGMSEHTVENIYKPFFTHARQTGGSGLGMHICYNLVVKVLGGQIDCHSQIGKGVEFVVTFPVTLR